MSDTDARVLARVANLLASRILFEMERVPHLPVPDGIRAWFGDFTWSSCAGPFREEWCRDLVPDLDEALAQLQFLYQPDVVESLVGAGHARLVYGLRGGARSWVDEKLQLGADLACCPGWRSRPKLIGDLRAPGVVFRLVSRLGSGQVYDGLV